MDRRSFLSASTAAGAIAAAPALAFQVEKSKLKITGVRLVKTHPKRPLPSLYACSDRLVGGRRRSRKPDVDLSGVQGEEISFLAGCRKGAELHRRNHYR